MAAVLGLATAEVEAACRAASSGGPWWWPQPERADQTVISGDAERRGEGGGRVARRSRQASGALKVSGAFHSSLMAPAANHLRVALEHAPFQDPAFR